MVMVSVSVSSELKRLMESFSEINWSEVARQAFAQKVRDLEFLRQMKSQSGLTEKDAVGLGRRLNKSLAKNYARGS
ncbi:MAG: hypothetical protein V1708_05340 [Candidatus Micrarchaeota archaeon]